MWSAAESACKLNQSKGPRHQSGLSADQARPRAKPVYCLYMTASACSLGGSVLTQHWSAVLLVHDCFGLFTWGECADSALVSSMVDQSVYMCVDTWPTRLLRWMVVYHGWPQVVCLQSPAAAFVMVGCLVRMGMQDFISLHSQAWAAAQQLVALELPAYTGKHVAAATDNGVIQTLWAAVLSQNTCAVHAPAQPRASAGWEGWWLAGCATGGSSGATTRGSGSGDLPRPCCVWWPSAASLQAKLGRVTPLLQGQSCMTCMT